MTSASENGSRSTLARVWGVIRGPRFVDLPIRLLALIMGLTVLVPGSFEIDEPRYMVLIIFAYALIVLAPFVPLVTVFVSTGLSLVFVVPYPDLENMFPEALILATAVLLSQRRLTGSVIATVGLVSYLVLSTELAAYDGGIEGVIDFGYGWLTYSLIGLAAGFVELRIQREIIRRERAAVGHQSEVESMRARFTSDMHDTISNSLATETAIIRTMAREPSVSSDSDRALAELALVNAEATKRLRQLVISLSSGEDQDSRISLHTEAQQLAMAIDNGCSAGSVPLSTHVGALPKYSSSTLGQNFRAILLELATNVIRYSTPGTSASLAVEMRGGAADRANLICRSVNEAPAGLSQTPRSLSRRAAAVNGTCRVSAEDKHVIVEVVLPVRYVPTASTSAVDGNPSEGMPIDAGEEIDVLCDHDDAASQEASGALRTPTSALAGVRWQATESTRTTALDSGSGKSESERTTSPKNRVDA